MGQPTVLLKHTSRRRRTRAQPQTVGELVQHGAARFKAMRLKFGHGTTNAHDEAAYLALHALRLPLARLERGTPALEAEDDAYVNHIHADDLARIVVAALRRSHPNRMYNAADDAPQKMGDYFDLVADRFGLPRPRRIPRSQAARELPGNLLSFMNESRRLVNRRVKEELRLRLRYPTVDDGIAAALASRKASAARADD